MVVVTETSGTQQFRVAVRGMFEGLTAPQRQALLRDVDAHDVVLVGRFSEEGTLTYEKDLVFFTFGFDITASGPDAQADAAAEAEIRALERLEQEGWGYRHLRAAASAVPQVKRR
jgi:hypothetical protein